MTGHSRKQATDLLDELSLSIVMLEVQGGRPIERPILLDGTAGTLGIHRVLVLAGEMKFYMVALPSAFPL